MLLTSVLSPVLLLLLWRGAAGRPASGFLVFLAAFSGLGALGGNAFALERRGLLLLLSFPVDRFEMLVGKNLAAMALRLPSLLALAVVAAFLAEPGRLLPLMATALVTLFLGAATDNLLSILYPVPVPEPGRNPHAPLSGSSRPRRVLRHRGPHGRDPRPVGAVRVPRLPARPARAKAGSCRWPRPSPWRGPSACICSWPD